MENVLDWFEIFSHDILGSCKCFLWKGDVPIMDRNCQTSKGRSIKMLCSFPAFRKTWVWPNFVLSKWSLLLLIFLYVKIHYVIYVSFWVFAQNLIVEFYKNCATRQGKSEYGENCIRLHFLEKFGQPKCQWTDQNNNRGK